MIITKMNKENTEELLKDLKVPKDLISLYTINAITNLGKKIGQKGYIVLNQYIFKIQNDQIVNAFFNIRFLRENPQYLP